MMSRYYKLKYLKTLLIDDDPFIRNSMELAFTQKGFPLRVVNTAEEGLRALRQEAFDIIVSDYKLPGMHGLDFFRKVIGRTPNTIKILVSGGGDHDAIATAYSIGIDDYLPKPFTIDSLWATLVMHAERCRFGEQQVISLQGEDPSPNYLNWLAAEYR